jgi:hypothetical protein
MYINSILAVICNTKQEERLCILLLFISRLPGLLPFYFLLLIPHFHRIWYRILFLPRLLLLSILALSSMSSLFPMGYLALTTAILHRVAQFEGMQWPQRCSRFAASGTTRISYAFTYRTV